MFNHQHPDLNQLEAYVSGRTPTGETPAIESHIETCSECCERLCHLRADDFTSLVVRAAKDEEQGPRPDLADLLNDHPRYRLGKLVGTGGMGDVYAAEHLLMQRQVAIKVISEKLIDNDQAAKRFHREVTAAAALSHPNIVRSYDADYSSGVHFLVMEYVRGIDLARYVAEQGPLSAEKASNYILQAARGLEHAHSKRMVHRDIKPGNLLLTEDDVVKILDFGLATIKVSPDTDTAGLETSNFDSKSNLDSALANAETTLRRDAEVLRRLTRAGSVVGTPGYISPEQAKDSHEADIRSDIYSLGFTFIFLLAGRLTKPPGATYEISPDIRAPKSLREIVNKMIAVQPDHRYQTPAELIEAISVWRARHSDPLGQKRATRLQKRGFSVVVALFVVALCMLQIQPSNQVNLSQPPTSNASVIWEKDRHRYHLLRGKNSTGVSWQDAQKEAKKLGGHLVRFEDRSEQNWLLQKLHYEFRQSQNNPGFVWIGLADVSSENDKAEGLRKWRWSDGSEPTFTNWAPGEPNDLAQDGGPEPYVSMYIVNGEWNDRDGKSPRNHYGVMNYAVVEVPIGKQE